MKIIVTGAGGFIGSHLIPHLKGCGLEPVPLQRSEPANPQNRVKGADALIHLAGIAHSTGVTTEAYREVNCELPVRLALAAKECGLHRFVFLSSSHAESYPEAPYGASKLEAERRLLDLGAPEIVIMRPTLVYGPDAKGNFRRLAASPLPLPFGAASARRSMVYVANLVDALTFAAQQPNFAGRVFTVTDPGQAPTRRKPAELIVAGTWLPGLLRRIGAGSRRKAVQRSCFRLVSLVRCRPLHSPRMRR